jgi:hypothetical protein
VTQTGLSLLLSRVFAANFFRLCRGFAAKPGPARPRGI